MKIAVLAIFIESSQPPSMAAGRFEAEAGPPVKGGPKVAACAAIRKERYYAPFFRNF
jgi:hypothetical protein